MVSLENAPPAGHLPLSNGYWLSASSSQGTAQPMASPSATSAEAATLLNVLERVLQDSDTRAQQAGFATLLRDFDSCVMQLSSK
jgi:hypothetical protein